MGALGAQGPAAGVRRIEKLAGRYAKLTSKPVLPAFEIIATMGTSEPGPRRNYSARMSPRSLNPWIEAARRAGVYVVLDLQPGRARFLDQAKHYRKLLELPHVGLALDAEWRLTPTQKPLEQIGRADAAEINKVIRWLADLTKTHDLPQKALVLHQFRRSMIARRERLDTSRRELALIVHSDGHGSPKDKRGAYRNLARDLPGHVRMGWKNFFRQDDPVFSPQQTLGVRPEPWFVSYQ